MAGRETVGFKKQSPFNLHRWQHLCRRLGLAPSTAIDQEFTRLQIAYGESHRSYHTAQHIHDCLTQLDWAKAQGVDTALQSPTLELALWYHDVVYEPQRSDNERLSANQAMMFLRHHGTESTQIDGVESLIMATCHLGKPGVDKPRIGKPGNNAIAAPWMIDIDLAIVGSQPQRFSQYGQQIRQEYSWVAETDYDIQRRAVLQLFLEQLPLYHTPLFRERFETQARLNLIAAVA